MRKKKSDIPHHRNPPAPGDSMEDFQECWRYNVWINNVDGNGKCFCRMKTDIAHQSEVCDGCRKCVFRSF